MALVLNGSANTIGGLAVGGLPDGIVDTDMLAANAVATAKIADSAVTSAKATGVSPFTRHTAFSFPNDQVNEVVDLTIPADATEFTISFTDVSSSGNEDLCFQLGTSSGIKTSGYECKASYINNNANPSSENITDMIRFKVDANTGNDKYGFCTFIHVNNNDWVFHGQAGSNRISDRGGLVVGQVAMGGTVTTLRCRCNGDSGFDLGVGLLLTRT